MLPRLRGCARFLAAEPIGQALLWLVIGGLLSVRLGLDDNWDLQNYHLYDPFAFLAGRSQLDLNAVGNQSTFFPLIDIPYYLLAVRWLPHCPRMVCFLAGLPYGALGFLLLRLALALGFVPELPMAWIAAGIGMTGTTVFMEIGTTFGDIPVACLVIAGLWQALRGLDAPQRWQMGCAWAGAGSGLAFALKLTAAVYIPALLVAILVCGPDARQRCFGAAAFLVANGICFLAVYGAWGWHLWAQYGNPFYPFLNNVFHSQWADPSFARAVKFLPRSVWQALFYPFFWLHGRAQVVSETGVRDWHFALAYLSVIAICLLRRKPPRRVLFLVIFVSAAFALWESLFSILRYALPLEVLTGPIILSALYAIARNKSFLLLFFKKEVLFFFEKKNQKTFMIVGASIFGFLLATSGWPGWGRLRRTPVTIFNIRAPALADGTTVAVAGEPVGFVIPFIQGQALRFLGLGAPPGTRLETEIAARLAAAPALRVLMLAGDAQAAQQLALFHIVPDSDSCQRILTDRRSWGNIVLCNVKSPN